MKLLVVFLLIQTVVNSKPVEDAYVDVHQDTSGNYKVTFNTGRFYKTEERTNDGEVTGYYSYVDPNSLVQKVHYTAGENGFLATGTNLPKDTPEVQKAKEEHLAAHKEAFEYHQSKYLLRKNLEGKKLPIESLHSGSLLNKSPLGKSTWTTSYSTKLQLAKRPHMKKYQNWPRNRYYSGRWVEVRKNSPNKIAYNKPQKLQKPQKLKPQKLEQTHQTPPKPHTNLKPHNVQKPHKTQNPQKPHQPHKIQKPIKLYSKPKKVIYQAVPSTLEFRKTNPILPKIGLRSDFFRSLSPSDSVLANRYVAYKPPRIEYF